MTVDRTVMSDHVKEQQSKHHNPRHAEQPQYQALAHDRLLGHRYGIEERTKRVLGCSGSERWLQHGFRVASGRSLPYGIIDGKWGASRTAMAKIGWGKILAGFAAAAAAGATYVYLKERSARSPLHETLLSEGGYEIRRYPALLLIETVQPGSRDRALGNGFGLLADYMFGEHREGDEIPMIVPVLAEPVTGGSWRIRFLIPEGYTRETLPVPGPGIAVAELPGREVAALKFGGKPSDQLLAAKEADLRAWIAAKERSAAEVAEHGYYNSPLRPGPIRQNEILIELS